MFARPFFRRCRTLYDISKSHNVREVASGAGVECVVRAEVSLESSASALRQKRTMSVAFVAYKSYNIARLICVRRTSLDQGDSVEHVLEDLVSRFEQGRCSRRDLLATLSALVAIGPVEYAATMPVPPFRCRELNHVTLRVRDLRRSRQFCAQLLGLRVIGEDKDSCRLGLGRGSSRFGKTRLLVSTIGASALNHSREPAKALRIPHGTPSATPCCVQVLLFDMTTAIRPSMSATPTTTSFSSRRLDSKREPCPAEVGRLTGTCSRQGELWSVRQVLRSRRTILTIARCS